MHAAAACVLFLGLLVGPVAGLEIALRGASLRRGAAAGAGCAFAPPLAGGLGALGKRLGNFGLSLGGEAGSVARGPVRVCRASLSAGDIGGRSRERGNAEGARLGGKTLGARTAAVAAAFLVGSVSVSAPKPVGAAAQAVSDRGAIVRVVDEGTQGRGHGGKAMLAFVDEYDDEDEDMLEEAAVETQAVAVQQEDLSGLVQHQVFPKLFLLEFSVSAVWDFGRPGGTRAMAQTNFHPTLP